MNIITNKILSSLLVAVCFIQTATGQISCRAEIKDGLVAKDTYCQGYILHILKRKTRSNYRVDC